MVDASKVAFSGIPAVSTRLEVHWCRWMLRDRGVWRGVQAAAGELLLLRGRDKRLVSSDSCRHILSFGGGRGQRDFAAGLHPAAAGLR